MSFDGFLSPEYLVGKEYVLASYLLECESGAAAIAAAQKLAIGQTTGTWVDVPGITEQMRQTNEGKVVRVIDIPAVDVVQPGGPQVAKALIQIAIRAANLNQDVAVLLTTILGNDASTSVLAKLVDLQLPAEYGQALGGPKYGIEGIRKLTGVSNRPLLLSMIKPCIGMSVEASAEIFYETALGGADLIKDDEVLTEIPGSRPIDRVVAFNKKAEQVFEETGHRSIYVVNITARPDKMVATAKQVAESGAKAVMVNYAAVGYGGVQAVRDAVSIPVLGHFAAVGPMLESPTSGMSAQIAYGQLPRYCGADMAITLTPYGGYALTKAAYQRTILSLTSEIPGIKPTLPLLGGGVHPGIVAKYIRECGQEIALCPGGGVHGHPSGSRAGAKAMRQAIQACLDGIPVEQAANENLELAEAIQTFGVVE